MFEINSEEREAIKSGMRLIIHFEEMRGGKATVAFLVGMLVDYIHDQKCETEVNPAFIHALEEIAAEVVAVRNN